MRLAAERSVDVSEGLAPDIRATLVFDAERAYEDWFERIQDGDLAVPSTPVEFILAEVFALDDVIHEAMESGRKPSDTLQ